MDVRERGTTHVEAMPTAAQKTVTAIMTNGQSAFVNLR